MLIHESRKNITEMVELWVYKTGAAASSFLRIIDCDEGFKVGVVEYINLENELITKEDNQSESDAKKIRQRILSDVKN
jgi:hypothetical protein